jgi:two-component system cell cycle sensor histidine kinase PleC
MNIEGRPMLGIRIEDNGPGINPALLSTKFEPFHQTSTIMENKPDGLGLGLPIVESIIAGHEGQLKLERSDQNGTVFVMALPIFEENR